MPKKRQEKFHLAISSFYIVLFLLFLTAGFAPPLSCAITSADTEKTAQSLNESTPAEVNEIMADLDDGQVRQLLKLELSKNTEDETISLVEEIPGPGTFLSSMLHSLTSISAESKSRLKELVSGLPSVFPDLYKVFLTL